MASFRDLTESIFVEFEMPNFSTRTLFAITLLIAIILVWVLDHRNLMQKVASAHATISVIRKEPGLLRPSAPQHRSIAPHFLIPQRATDIQLLDVYRAFLESKKTPVAVEDLAHFAGTILTEELRLETPDELLSLMEERGLRALVTSEREKAFIEFFELSVR